MVCGEPVIDIEMLKANTIYAGEFASTSLSASSLGETKSGSDARGGSAEASVHKVVQWFWEIMEEKFTNQDRSNFLMFAWGRTRLPLNEKDFTTKMEIIVSLWLDWLLASCFFLLASCFLLLASCFLLLASCSCSCSCYYCLFFY